MSVSGSTPRGIVLAASGVSANASATSGASGAWVQVIASTSAAIYITGISLYGSGGMATGTVSIGTGAAASEVTVFTFTASAGGSTYGGGMSMALAFPIRVPSGTRVAISRATGSNDMVIGVTYVNESAVV